MKQTFVQDDKVWIIEARGSSYIVKYGQANSSTLRESKKDFDSEDACKKGIEKAIRTKLKGGYIELTLNIPNVSLPLLAHVQLAKVGLVKELRVEHWDHASPQLIREICTCSELEALDIAIEFDVPSEVGNLINLKELSITGKGITSIPEKLGKLTQLEKLSISSASANKLPESIGELKQLKNLYISGMTKLTGIPAGIGQCVSLKELTCSSCGSDLSDGNPDFEFVIPPEIGNLSALKKLDLEYNSLKTVPGEIGNLRNLKKFELDGNPITFLPYSLGELPRLKTLSLDEDAEIENIPAELVAGASSIFDNDTESVLHHLRQHAPSSGGDIPEVHVPVVPSDRESILQPRIQKLNQYFSDLKQADELDEDYIDHLKSFITGRTDNAPTVRTRDASDLEDLPLQLNPINDWCFVDERIMYFVCQSAFYFTSQYFDVKSGYHDEFFNLWMVPQLNNETPNEDTLGNVFSFLEKYGIGMERATEAFFSGAKDAKFVDSKSAQLNSAGRFVLAEMSKNADKLWPMVTKKTHVRGLLHLLFDHDRDLLDRNLHHVLTLQHQDSYGTSKHIGLLVAEMFLKRDANAYAPAVLGLMADSDCPSCIAQSYWLLLKYHNQSYYQDAFNASKTALQYISTQKNNDRRFTFDWLPGDGHIGFIEWIMEAFGGDILPSLSLYIKETHTMELKVIRRIVSHYRQAALDIAIEALNLTPKEEHISHFREAFNIIEMLDFSERVDVIWGLAKEKNETIANIACLALLDWNTEAVMSQAETWLNSMKVGERRAAVSMLMILNDGQSKTLIKPLWTSEKNEVIRNIAIALTFADQDISAVSKVTMQERIAVNAKLGKLDKPAATWLKNFPKLYWNDKEALSSHEVNYLFYRQKSSGSLKPDLESAPIYQHLDRHSYSEFALFLYKEVIKNGGFVAKNRWAFAPMAMSMSNELVAPLTELAIKEKNENACQVLGLLATLESAFALDSIMDHYSVKYPNVHDAAKSGFECIADTLDLTVSELQVSMIPDIGFTGMSGTYALGSQNYTVTLGTDFIYAYSDNQGERCTLSPADAEEKAEVKERDARLAQVVKQYQRALEKSLIDQRIWLGDDWLAFYTQNPVAAVFAQTLVWHSDGGEDFVLSATGDAVLCNGQTRQLVATEKVRLRHPLHLSESDTTQWQEYIATHKLQQPIKQLLRTVYRVNQQDVNVKYGDQFNGIEIMAGRFKGLATKSGWRRGFIGDAGSVTGYSKTFARNIDAYVETENLQVDAHLNDEEMTLGQFCFTDAGSIKASGFKYGAPFSESDHRLIPFGEVEDIVYSEAVADLMSFK